MAIAETAATYIGTTFQFGKCISLYYQVIYFLIKLKSMSYDDFWRDLGWKIETGAMARRVSFYQLPAIESNIIPPPNPESLLLPVAHQLHSP